MTPARPTGTALGSAGPALGAAGVALVLTATLAGGWWTPYDPTAVVGLPFALPGADHPLGTDVLGRDVLSRALAGGRDLVLLSAAAGAATCLVGLSCGLLAGWRRGWVGGAISAAADVLVATPVLLVALVLAATLPGPAAVVAATVVAGAPLTTQIVRDAARAARSAGWAEAARCRGEGTAALLAREVLPAMSGLVVAEIGLRFVLGLQLACTLTILNFGAQPPSPDWALMLRENLPGSAVNPAAVAAPALLLTVLGCTVALALRVRPGTGTTT